MKRFTLIVIVIFIFIIALIGCVNKSIIDRVSIPLVIGVDKGPKTTMILTISKPQYKGKDTITNVEATAVSQTIINARGILLEEENTPILSGKLSVLLCSRQLAKEGLEKAIDMALRNPRVSKRLQLAVVDGQAKELLEANYSHSVEKGHYLIQQFNSNIKEGHLPRTNLHTFEYALLGKGIDPYLPLVKLEEGKFKITGLALFQKDKYVDSLNNKELKFFKLLVEKKNHGTYETKLREDVYVSVQNEQSSFRYKASFNNVNPEIDIKLKLKGSILESAGFEITDNDRQHLESTFSKEIVNAVEDLIHRFQKLGIDPLGLGNFVRSRTRHWDENIWEEQYPNIKIKINADVSLIGEGDRK
ncbi:spore germination protein [Paenibacillus sp. V4I3]|uniref:Ger(x)C family spore germination protein n=1 Tax=unclassified Paenibacillus TaxID=185978 RepID=UPI0027832892|nr:MULTISPECIES: Ger(x)C family spore germination protein [unclassified Paenibacillus]MDQ0878787.1 spore germination protein [Paenibacillus sp. V4I3]MDQ0885361.1 spore germination protein [Paenibacillus sp. V4I9]